ncbi:MAG: tRNA-specific adenosine deaminase [Omnitrophica WOR_2 bacterium GWF2_38_59]|nr:MAG: tRNA-specific adenosine deaminase [Omnitrophica WOR_2 bacterium GWF2_38_59]OGX50280.1 MAG: tRNA-specific adenosine deaminase [Omnitrophica WOR_2 bacterium RIFOXYA2_FULL_38_17]OGX54399.1 MAG: tRNA-specific adenosine deaminase [Omnitrophica WOR_2 bacterium RIFOXYA12_FULL_38_10]OGX58918.1 MAG: tRNA-specific adenosine deaminase [Omnitrophica WOR_2 bacterium RIFOXYC2_FULL_38_12]OGX60527.1 MAG: tRNA-specific adenosine deaminase [Omnitrophica WOR_2 bacterium RIFOXYB2_FULL_38_16]
MPAFKPNEKYMKMAIEKAREGVKKWQTPFGACIVKDNKILSCVHNTVWKTTDITSHAEVHAIRKACKEISSIDLSGSVIYSTCEPCPMCFSAIHWANIATIVYGAKIKDARSAGFHELTISNRRMKTIGGSPVAIIEGFLRKENLELFKEWINRSDRKTY